MGVQITLRHVEWHNGKLVAAYWVPDRLQPVLKRKVIRRSLGTTDERVADQRFPKAWDEIQAMVRAAEAAAASPIEIRAADFLARELGTAREEITTLLADKAKLEERIAERQDRLKWTESYIAEVRGMPPPPDAPPLTFREASERLIQDRLATNAWKHPGKHAAKWRQTFRHLYPTLGDKLISEIVPADLMQALRKPKVPQAARAMAEAVFRFAIANGWRKDANPAVRESLDLPPPPPAKPRESVPWQEIPALMRRLAEIDSPVADCIRFIVLCAPRKEISTQAAWNQIDLAEALWTVPAQQTKHVKGRLPVDYKITLPHQAVALLESRQAKRLPRHGDAVFPNRDRAGAGISQNACNAMLARLGYEATIHGMRASFGTWCTDHDKDVQTRDYALQHIESGQEAAYNRTTKIAQRRVLLQEWADYCTDGT